MEIFTYIIEGQLEHRDSMGNGSTIEAGDLQYMSAGSAFATASSIHQRRIGRTSIRSGFSRTKWAESHAMRRSRSATAQPKTASRCSSVVTAAMGRPRFVKTRRSTLVEQLLGHGHRSSVNIDAPRLVSGDQW